MLTKVLKAPFNAILFAFLKGGTYIVLVGVDGRVRREGAAGNKSSGRCDTHGLHKKCNGEKEDNGVLVFRLALSCFCEVIKNEY
jgi:hypothetical protein